MRLRKSGFETPVHPRTSERGGRCSSADGLFLVHPLGIRVITKLVIGVRLLAGFEPCG